MRGTPLNNFTFLKMTTREKKAKIHTGRLELTEIETARQAIDQLDQIRRDNGISQMRMAAILNDPDTGQRLYRAFRSGNCSLAYAIRWARANGVKVYFGMCKDVDELDDIKQR